MFLLAATLALPALAQQPAKGALYTRAEDGVIRAALEIELDPGWHIYHGPTQADLGHPRAIGSPTTVTLAGAGIEWSSVRFPEPEKIDQGVIEPGVWINAHSGQPVIYAIGRLAPGASGADVTAKVKGLVCEEACIPYREELTSGGRGPDELFAKFPGDLQPPGPGDAAGAAGPDGGSGASADDAAAKGADKGLLLFLLAAIGGGLFALVMPCTYPMIPITISFFTKQADARGGAPIGLSLAYGAGIVLIFVLIGVVFGSAIGPFAAHPVTNLVIGIAFLYFALVLFGLVDLQPPRFLLNAAGAASMRGGYAGVFLMGATLVVTSFTCTAPFVGTLLGAGAGDLGRVALGMGVFGLTMAVPFVVLSLVPVRIRALPRSGEWMNTFKVTLGFVEVAAALKFLSNSDLVWNWRLFSRELFLLAWVLLFVAAALYLFGVFSKGTLPGSRRKLAGVLMLAFAFYCFWGMTGRNVDRIMTAIIPPYSGGRLGWEWHAETPTWPIVVDDYEGALARAKADGRLLLVNFTGYTCVNCRLNEETVFPAKAVRSLLEERFVEARLHTDGPDGERLGALQKELTQSVATPLYFVQDPRTRERLGGTLGGATSVGTFERFLLAALEPREKVGRR